MSKRFGGNMGCKDKTSSLWHLIGFPDGSNVGSTRYNVGEKPIVILYTYMNRHARTPNITKTKDTMSPDTAQFCYNVGSRIGWHAMGVSTIILPYY